MTACTPERFAPVTTATCPTPPAQAASKARSSSVVPANGAVSLGAPMRCDLPAASTQTQTFAKACMNPPFPYAHSIPKDVYKRQTVNWPGVQ